MLLFQAPQPVGGSTQYFPIYYRPVIVYLGLTSAGQPILGAGFGTGDRDDITAKCNAATRSTSYNQRFYFVVDKANTQTVTESTAGMLRIATSGAAGATTIPAAGWYVLLGTSSSTLAERVITDSLAINKYIYFFTESPAAGTSGGSCPPPSTCTVTGGLVRRYTMYYANGNPSPPATDRATQSPTLRSRPTRSSMSRRTSPAMSPSRPITASSLPTRQWSPPAPTSRTGKKTNHHPVPRLPRSISSRPVGGG